MALLSVIFLWKIVMERRDENCSAKCSKYRMRTNSWLANCKQKLTMVGDNRRKLETNEKDVVIVVARLEEERDDINRRYQEHNAKHTEVHLLFLHYVVLNCHGFVNGAILNV